MCGRFILTTPAEQLAVEFAVDDVPQLIPRYNIAPSQAVAVIALKQDGVRRGLAKLRWGLVPSWSNDPNAGPKPVNARSDSLNKPTFRDAFRSKRCLIPADGFYEWATVGKAKQPHHFCMASRRPFAFAGLWEVWTDGATKLITCCLITTDANDLVRPIHDRMPVILKPEDYTPWLDHSTPFETVKALLKPFPAEDMESFTVSPHVNKPTHDGPECLQPVDSVRPVVHPTLW